MTAVIIILAVLFAAEIAFSAIDLKTRRRHLREKGIARIVSAVLIVLLALCGALIGFSRYGGAVTALLISGTLCFIPRKEKEIKPAGAVFRLIGSILLYTIALIPAMIFPQYKEPVVTGSHEVKTAVYTWVDKSRTETYTDTGENRSVTVKLFYPAAEGKYPLAVFSHGSGGMIDSNYSTCTELASNGYVAVSIAHPYHAIFVEDTDGKTTMVDREFMNQAFSGKFENEETCFKVTSEWMEIRTGDMNFVLDALLDKAKCGETPFNMIDNEHIGLFGHSLGGATAVETGRTRDDIDAVISLEGTMLGEYVGIENGKRVCRDEPYPIPVLDVNSRMVYDRMVLEKPQYVNFSVVENAADGREIIFNGAAHMNFCDLPLVSPILSGMIGTGEVDSRECIENVNSMVLKYFNHYLKGEPSLDLPNEY